jgi:hypothetical protein
MGTWEIIQDILSMPRVLTGYYRQVYKYTYYHMGVTMNGVPQNGFFRL